LEKDYTALMDTWSILVPHRC